MTVLDRADLTATALADIAQLEYAVTAARSRHWMYEEHVAYLRRPSAWRAMTVEREGYQDAELARLDRAIDAADERLDQALTAAEHASREEAS